VDGRQFVKNGVVREEGTFIPAALLARENLQSRELFLSQKVSSLPTQKKRKACSSPLLGKVNWMLGILL
jgi:hypothetical protein